MYVVKHARRNNGNQQFNKKPEGICLFSFEMKNWLTKQASSLGLGSKTNQWQQSLRIESLNKSFLNRLDLCLKKGFDALINEGLHLHMPSIIYL